MDCQLEEAVLNLIKLQFVDCLGQQVSPGIDNQNVLSYNSMNEWTDLWYAVFVFDSRYLRYPKHVPCHGYQMECSGYRRYLLCDLLLI